MRRMTTQMNELITNIYEREKEDTFLKDVYVTDHKPKEKKVILEDEADALKYKMFKDDLATYFSKKTKPLAIKKPKYHRGSYLQRLLDPLAGAEKQLDGSLLLTFDDVDLKHQRNSEEGVK
jgi:hypothetical protein